MKVPAARIVFSDQDRAEILRMVDESLQTGSLTLGPHTVAFEEAFAELHGVPHAVATSSGTERPGDHVPGARRRVGERRRR